MGNIFKSIGSALGSVGKSMAGPFVGALGSIVGSVINSNANKNAVREQNAAQMELAKYKYEKDLEMWNRQNEYNSPSAQMARFAEAGLNPNFMYGQGTSGNASSAPSYETPSINAYTHQDFGIGAAASGGVDAYLRALSLEKENKVRDSLIAKYNQEAQGQEIRNAGYIVDNTIKHLNAGILSKFGVEQAYANWQNTIANTNYINARKMLTHEQESTEQVRGLLVQAQYEHELAKRDLTVVEKAKVLADIAYIQQHKDVLEEEYRALKYENDVRPDVSKEAELRAIEQSLAIADGEADLSSIGYRKWLGYIDYGTSTIGHVLGGGESVVRMRRYNRLRTLGK